MSLKDKANFKKRKEMRELRNVNGMGSWEELSYYLMDKIESLEGDLETFSTNALKRMKQLQEEIEELEYQVDYLTLNGI